MDSASHPLLQRSRRWRWSAAGTGAAATLVLVALLSGASPSSPAGVHLSAGDAAARHGAGSGATLVSGTAPSTTAKGAKGSRPSKDGPTSTVPATGSAASPATTSTAGPSSSSTTSTTPGHGAASSSTPGAPEATTTTTKASATTTTSAPPSGSFQGVFEYAGANSTADAADPDIAGVDLDYYWSQIEPTKGAYDWSVITSAMAPWVAHGKKVIIRLATAGQASWDAPYSGSGTPAWVYADGATSVTDSGETVPVYWNPHYLSDLATFLDAFAAEFNGNPDVVDVEAGVGMGGETMPETNLSSTGLAAWEAAGYSAATWMTTVETISTDYRQDFTRTPVSVLLTSSFLGGDWPDYEALAAWYADASPPWPMQNDALSATSTLPDPAAWARAPQLLLEQAQPTSRSGDTLAADIDNALAQHATFVLVYRSDIDDAANAAVLASTEAKV